MNEQGRWNLVAKYLFGECTEAEKARVQAWVEADPERKRWVAELREVLRATADEKSRTTRDVEANWQRMARYIEQKARAEEAARHRSDVSSPPVPPRDALEDARQDRSPVTRRPSRRARRHARVPRALLAVPVVVAMCVAVVMLWRAGGGLPGQGPGGEAKVFATERGERATVRLADGTLVRLNAASSVTLSPSFGDERREVQLEGEGYFEVAHDSDRPFIVRSGTAVTRVLGTAFNVSAYPEDDRVEVLVAEGRVAFARGTPSGHESDGEGGQEAGGLQGDDADEVVLTARQMATLVASGQVVRGTADLERLAWLEGELYFRDAPFSEVVRKLGRWYDLDVELAEGAMPEGHLNARFSEGQSQGEVLSIVAAAFGLRYEQEARTVRFYATEAP